MSVSISLLSERPNKLGLRCSMLHIFMDSFQGCYKNGTSGIRDCRCFAGLYLLIRIALIGVYTLTWSLLYYPLATVVLVAFVITFVVLQPYRSAAHNVTDSFLILSMIICYSSVMALLLTLQLLTQAFLSLIISNDLSISFSASLLYRCACCILVGCQKEPATKALPQTVYTETQQKNSSCWRIHYQTGLFMQKHIQH